MKSLTKERRLGIDPNEWDELSEKTAVGSKSLSRPSFRKDFLRILNAESVFLQKKIKRTYSDIGQESQYFVDRGPNGSFVGKPTPCQYVPDKPFSLIKLRESVLGATPRYLERCKSLCYLSHVFYEKGFSDNVRKHIIRLSLIWQHVSYTGFSKLLKRILYLHKKSAVKVN